MRTQHVIQHRVSHVLVDAQSIRYSPRSKSTVGRVWRRWGSGVRYRTCGTMIRGQRIALWQNVIRCQGGQNGTGENTFNIRRGAFIQIHCKRTTNSMLNNCSYPGCLAMYSETVSTRSACARLCFPLFFICLLLLLYS